MTQNKKIAVAVFGATGYTGLELVRLLVQHPFVKIEALTARQNAGQKWSSVFPTYLGTLDLIIEEQNVDKIAPRIDVAFLCLPHHQAMNVAADLRAKGVTVIDLSADFRIKNVTTYETWYGEHTQQPLIKEAVYGLPELHRDEIKKAKLIASPGCYATTNILALAPLLKAGLIHTNQIICDSKSGTTGAGRAAQVDTLFCEVNESFKAYKVGAHRHGPEIEQELSLVAGSPINLLFSPHLVPMDRGIFTTVYAKPKKEITAEALQQVYNDFYKDEPFVKILPAGIFPTTKQVRYTNNLHLSVLLDQHTQQIVVLGALDNLTKGASGQALQSFNLIFGFDETTALTQVAAF